MIDSSLLKNMNRTKDVIKGKAIFVIIPTDLHFILNASSYWFSIKKGMVRIISHYRGLVSPIFV